MKPTYLGDSVYASLEQGIVKLYTDNGDDAKDIIWLEDQVFIAFVKYIKKEVLEGQLDAKFFDFRD